MSPIAAVAMPSIETPTVSPKPSTRKLAIRGTLWTVAGYGLGQILRLGSNLVLTRLLAPSIFGIMALVQVTLQGLAMFSDIGVGPSVIRAKEEDPTFLNTAWTVQFWRGWMLWAICIALAYPLARFYNAPELKWIIIVSGISAVLGGSQSMSLFTQNRRLAIKSLTVLGLVTQIISLIVMITLAAMTRSIWALVAGGLVGVACTSVGSHLFLPGVKTRFRWDNASLHELIRFGKWIFISTILGFISAQLDRIILGKLVSLSVLGVYSIAITLAAVPKNIVGQISGTVVYPVYSRYAHVDRAEYARKVLKARRALLPAAIVVTAGLVTISPPFFHWLYDSRYADAAWMSQCFAIYMWFWILETSVSPALLALGHSLPLSITCLVNAVFTVAGCLAGYEIAGVLGFVLGLSVSSIMGHLVMEIFLYRHGVNIFWQDLLFTAGALLLTGVAFGIGRGVGPWMPAPWRHPAEMLIPNLVVVLVGMVIAQRFMVKMKQGGATA